MISRWAAVFPAARGIGNSGTTTAISGVVPDDLTDYRMHFINNDEWIQTEFFRSIGISEGDIPCSANMAFQ
jgi:hypothetical protein